MRGHVPLERREDDLAGVAARRLRLLDERRFVARHAGRERNRAAGNVQAGMVALGHAQVIRQRGPVQLVAVEGLVQHGFQRGLGIVGLDGVHVQVAGAPCARDHGGLGLGVGSVTTGGLAGASSSSSLPPQALNRVTQASDKGIRPAAGGLLRTAFIAPASGRPATRGAAQGGTMPAAGDVGMTGWRRRAPLAGTWRRRAAGGATRRPSRRACRCSCRLSWACPSCPASQPRRPPMPA